MTTELTSDLQQTTIGVSTPASVLVLAVTTGAGGGLGALLPALTGWLLALPWVPLQGPLTLVDRLADAAPWWLLVVVAAPWWLLVVVAAVVGALAGLGTLEQCTSATVTPREVVLVRGSRRRRWARAQVHEVVLEGRHLSLRDERDVDLVREAVDGSAAALAETLRRHGWPLRTPTGS
jgi:hypothetical protein